MGDAGSEVPGVPVAALLSTVRLGATLLPRLNLERNLTCLISPPSEGEGGAARGSSPRNELLRGLPSTLFLVSLSLWESWFLERLRAILRDIKSQFLERVKPHTATTTVCRMKWVDASCREGAELVSAFP